MKTKFFKVLLVLLAISLLIIPAGADSNTASNAKLEAVAAGTVALDRDAETEFGGGNVQVHVVAKEALTNLVGIEGSWSTAETEDTSYFKLTSISLDAVGQDLGTHNFTDIETGKLLWTDDLTFIGKGINAGGTVLTATYEVSKNTPDGEYTVTFTSTALITGSLSTGFDYDQDETVYEATITVKHICKTDDDHTTAENPATCTSDGHKAYYECLYDDCSNLYSDKACTNAIANLNDWKANAGKIPAIDHDWDEPEYIDNGDGTHTASYVCKNNASHTKSDAPAPHDFTNGDCVCGKKKGLKGDVDLDGDVDSEDAVIIFKHAMEASEITNDLALLNAEVTGDGEIDSEDAVKVFKYAMEAIDSLD